MQQDQTKIYPFCKYTCEYYSASSSPWEAAYIRCFNEMDKQVGIIFFVYPEVSIPAGQVNRIEPGEGVYIYYPLTRFDDVINMLRYSVNNHYCDCNDKEKKHEVGLEKDSVLFSVNEQANIWAICNNYRIPVGAQYHV